MKNNKIFKIIFLTITQSFLYFFIFYLGMYFYNEYYGISKSHISWGIAFYYSIYLIAILTLIGNTYLIFKPSKDKFYLTVIIPMILLIIYWFNSMFIYPNRTIFILIISLILFLYPHILMKRFFLKNE